MSAGTEGLGKPGDVSFQFIQNIDLTGSLTDPITRNNEYCRVVGRTLRSEAWAIDGRTIYSTALSEEIATQTGKTNSASLRILNAGLLPKSTAASTI